MIKRTAAVLCCIFATLFAGAQSLKETEPQPADELDQQPGDSTSKAFDPELQRTFVISGMSGHLDLNPRTSSYTNEAQVINGLQEGLFSYNPSTLDPVPAIAENYKISRDKKRWTFTIRQNAKFSDGTPITAQTVIDSWLALEKTPNAPYASLLDCISGLKEYREKVADASTVGLKANGQKLIITLKTPTAYLARILCHHAFSVYSGNPEVFSGAYTVAERTENAITLKKNENYWDKDNVALNEIQIYLMDNKDENTWYYNTGRADWIYNTVDTEKLLNKDSIRISALFGTTYYFFTCKNPVWDKADFRNALITAIPWDKLRKDVLIQASTLVYPLSGYPTVEGLTDSSEEEAVELMELARKNAGIPAGKELEISFGIADNDYMKEMVQILKDAWAPLGVKLVPYKINEFNYLESIPYLNYDLFAYSWIGDFADPMAFLELFRNGSTLNQTKWSNEKFTELLNKSDETTDAKERFKVLSQAEQVLIDDGEIIPISHSISLHAVNPNQVGGWYTNALDIHPFKYLYLKKYESSTAPNVVMR